MIYLFLIFFYVDGCYAIALTDIRPLDGCSKAPKFSARSPIIRSEVEAFFRIYDVKRFAARRAAEDVSCSLGFRVVFADIERPKLDPTLAIICTEIKMGFDLLINPVV